MSLFQNYLDYFNPLLHCMAYDAFPPVHINCISITPPRSRLKSQILHFFLITKLYNKLQGY